MKKIFLILFSIISLNVNAKRADLSNWEYNIPAYNFVGRAYEYKSLDKCIKEARKDAYQKAILGSVGAFVSLERAIDDVEGDQIKYTRVLAFDSDSKYYGFADAFTEREKHIENNSDGTYDCFVRISTTELKLEKLRNRNWQ